MRNSFRIAKARDKASKDTVHIKYIKANNGGLLTRESDVKARWKDDFRNLLNEENPRNARHDVTPNEIELEDL